LSFPDFTGKVRMRESLASLWNQNHAQVFSREDRSQSGCEGRITGDIEGAAAVDSRSQVAQECHAGRARLDMTAHLIAGEGFHPTIQVFGKIAKQLSAFIGALPALGLLPFGLLGQQLAALHVFRRVAQNLAHLLTHAQTRTMEANPDSSLLEVKNLTNLLGR
jgi:hypothetical protein